MIVVGCVDIAVGLVMALSFWLSPIVLSERWGDALFSGPIAGLVIWAGVNVGILPSIRVNTRGLDVRNPLRSAFIPWSAITAARAGFFGLRIDTPSWSMPVFAAQVSNAARALPEELRPVEQLAADLTTVRDHYLGQSQDVEPRDVCRRWNISPWAVAAILLWTALTFWWVFTR